MARKRKLNLNDWNQIPTTQVENKSGWETRAQFYAREAKERQDEQNAAEEELMAPVKAAEVEMHKATAEASVRLKRFWSLPLADIAEYGIEFAPADLFGDFPLQERARVKQTEIAAYEKCKSNLAAVGVNISPEGWNRVGGYLEALHYHRNISLSAVKSWELAVSRLHQLGCQPGEFSGYEEMLARDTPKPESKPAATPTWDAVQGLSTENRDQRKKVLEAVGEDFTGEIAAFFGLWQEQLARDYNYVIPEALIKRALRYVTDNNLSPLQHETWNIVRRVFVKNGWFPAGMLTEREKLSAFCDTADLNDREIRRQIQRRNMEIMESEPAFQPHK